MLSQRGVCVCLFSKGEYFKKPFLRLFVLVLMTFACLTVETFSYNDPFPPSRPDANQRYSGEEDALNDGEVNGNWTPQEKALHEARLKAKAKRRQRKSSRNSTSESFSEPGELVAGDPNSPKGKVATNDRKSRTGKGRGLPKKGRVELLERRLEFRSL